MYTRCPECGTPFRIAPAQLEARAGLVRCGRCSAVFDATEHLFVAPPPAVAVERPGARRTRGERRRRGRRSSDAADAGIPTVSERPTRRRVALVFWGLGDVLLLVALAAQFVYFFRNELALYPPFEPHVRVFCELARCEIAPRPPPAPPELSEATIAPHPRYANALRIRASFVNRAAQPRPHPLMQVTLTDSNGAVLARRVFRAAQYLEKPAAAGMIPPDVVVRALIDVTNPDGRAVGYEIQLLSSDETTPN